MKDIFLPFWLIVLIIGLPQISETIYVPSLPDVANFLKISEGMAEHTLTFYLFGFALGTLFWGKLSDIWGRKPCVIAGLTIFMLGCLGGAYAPTIKFLMLARLIQAFGGSIGSVLGQAICRDIFQGAALGKAYAKNNTILATFPAIGSIIGGIIAEKYGWQGNFLFLVFFALGVIGLIIKFLPETINFKINKKISMRKLCLDLIKNKKVMGLGLIVAASYGLFFSYFAEGSFYLIKLLGLSPSKYGLSFIVVALGGVFGGIFSKKLHNYCSSKTIMGYGILTMLITTGTFTTLIVLHKYIPMNNIAIIWITIIAQMFIMIGNAMITSTALALALVDYQWCIGAASSLFGFYYYCGISLVTLIMGILRNGSLIVMPSYFFGVCIFMWLIKKVFVDAKFKFLNIIFFKQATH